MEDYEKNIKTDSVQPEEPLKVQFGLTICPELDKTTGLLNTHGWLAIWYVIHAVNVRYCGGGPTGTKIPLERCPA